MRRFSLICRASIAAAALMASAGSQAIYNANIQGVITSIRVYDDGRTLLRLHNQPTYHVACNANYFGIDASLSADVRAALLSRAMTAKNTNETVNIGYDNSGNCAGGYIRVHEIGW